MAYPIVFIKIIKNCRFHLAVAAEGLTGSTVNDYDRNGGYLAVLPERRRHGYVDNPLGFLTTFHTTTGAPQITATTDTLNTPTAAAFARVGCRCTEVQIDHEP